MSTLNGIRSDKNSSVIRAKSYRGNESFNENWLSLIWTLCLIKYQNHNNEMD